ncbi:UNVERIFIED_CONTAM: hypothetical protein Slati_3847500 [Sesamum latifolium]|uniref:Secreted protein n=1 Tax=Sesamum latifolium TaxID=2727402 RepID=A0AAW2TKP0_9LAMI
MLPWGSISFAMALDVGNTTGHCFSELRVLLPGFSSRLVFWLNALLSCRFLQMSLHRASGKWGIMPVPGADCGLSSSSSRRRRSSPAGAGLLVSREGK